ncbi:MAG: hypothetical protein KAR47_06585 [Planctomycetes bacterium]|nr:hypothetical protein [Planctomycetota bacterium]
MKKLIPTACLLIVLIGVAITAGCEEKVQIVSDRHARLVGDENLQLRKQLNAKDREVEQLNDRLEKCTNQLATVGQKAGEVNIAIMGKLSEQGPAIEALTSENVRLKKRIKELEAKQR